MTSSRWHRRLPAITGLVAVLFAGTACTSRAPATAEWSAATLSAPTAPSTATSAPPEPLTSTSTTPSGTPKATTEVKALPPAPPEGFGGPVTVTFAGAPPLRVEVASTPAQRARGLMQRETIQAGTGMLFVFPRPSSGGFWMLGTLVPLSIAYVDDGRVVSIAEMQPCPPADAGCPTYEAAAPYTAAVEAPGGFFTEHGIRPGAVMSVDGSTPSPR